TDSAVQIPNGFCAVEVCVFQCFGVQAHRLAGIYLEEGEWGDLIINVSDLICDVTLSPEDFNFIAKDHVASLFVYVQGNAGHPGDCGERGDQFSLMRDRSSVYDKAYHQFAGIKTAADKNMPYQSFPRCLIIGFNVKSLHMGQDYVQNFFILRYAQGAVPVLHDHMGAPCVKTGY